jgi:hypothetical protein
VEPRKKILCIEDDCETAALIVEELADLKPPRQEKAAKSPRQRHRLNFKFKCLADEACHMGATFWKQADEAAFVRVDVRDCAGGRRNCNSGGLGTVLSGTASGACPALQET